MQTRESDVLFAIKIINDICSKYNIDLITLYYNNNNYVVGFSDNITKEIYLDNGNIILK